MKKYFYLLSLLLLTSCYEDYVKDNTFSGVYFTYQTDVRSFIVDEDMDFKVGAVLGGVLENDSRRVVKFSRPNELVTNDLIAELKKSNFNYIVDAAQGVTEVKVMPEDWYTLSNTEEMIIEKGRHSGTVTVTSLDDKLMTDDKAYKAIYAIPFKIESADADSIMEGKDYQVVFVKYESKIFGRYYHYGRWSKINADGTEDENNSKVIEYKVPMGNETITELTTNGPTSVWTSTIANTLPYRLNIVLNDDNTLSVSKADVPENQEVKSIEEIEPGCKFNNELLIQDRMMFLNYKVTFNDNTSIIARDTLKFMERIHDGVSEWRDLDSDKYDK